jgi:molecular chaperone DnaK (HSP70)
MTSKYVVGIDLGTTNSVVAFAPLEGDLAAGEVPPIELLPIGQLVAANTVESRPALPSFLFLADERQAGEGSLDLPWAARRTYAVGEWARRQSADVPERTVAAAKSWLCYSRVDRRQPILPWGAGADVPKVSPVEAARRYLEHLGDAWKEKFPDHPLADQQVVLTVPASFDAAARELTREAAQAAGLPAELILLEEPQAAVYAWLASQVASWRSTLRKGDQLLVCDVGGGTTDLSLIDVSEEEGELALRRLAVGDHLLVGGDNMDLALAHQVAQQLSEQGLKLDAWQSVSLWHACRNAKEHLLAQNGPESYPVSVLGRGRKLIGGTVSTEVPREMVQRLLVEGFFPRCAATDLPQRQRASGFRQIGLPFESDAAITRHLAAFLGKQLSQSGDACRPTHVLFNGGVFKADALRQRVLQTLGDWSAGTAPVQELAADADLDNAVARGAAFYAWTKHHGGVRIRGGVPRSYYVGVETAGLAIPGAQRPLRALCVVPRGMEEGTAVDVPMSSPGTSAVPMPGVPLAGADAVSEIGLVVGESAHFRFFSCATRAEDRPGDVIDDWQAAGLLETDPFETTLEADETLGDTYVPVRFETRITELGVLELWCVSLVSDHRWKLQMSVREDAQQAPGALEPSEA